MSPPTSLASKLLESAGDMTRSSLDAFMREDFNMFYLHAGIGLEHLLKSLLAAISPALIAEMSGGSHQRESRTFEMMYALCQDVPTIRELAHSIRTVGLVEAIGRASHIATTLRPLRPSLTEFGERRNSVAHLGIVDAAVAREDLNHVSRGVMAALTHLREERGFDEATESAFFDTFSDFVAALASESAEEKQTRTLGKIAAAAAEFARRYPDGISEALVEAIHGQDWRNGYEYQVITCPACDNQAVVHGDAAVDYDVEVDDHREGILSAYPYVLFTPWSFLCRICGLELDELEELAAVDLDEPWPLDDADLRDFLWEDD